MPRSRQDIACLHCPSCGEPFEVPVWLIVDGLERPDLVRALLDGTLNVTACPHCQAEGGVDHPLLFHDAGREQVVCALPLSVIGEDAARRLVGDLLQGLVETIPDRERRPYLGAVELVPELDGLRAALVEQALADDTAHEDQQLSAVLEHLLNAPSQSDFQRIIAEHRRILFTDHTDHALDEMLVEARRIQDRELQRRLRDVKAILGRVRTVLHLRRRALTALLDDLAPLSDAEAGIVPELNQMLGAIDPQEVYAGRIALSPEQQMILDGLMDRLVACAEAAHEAEAAAFVRNLQALPRQ